MSLNWEIDAIKPIYMEREFEEPGQSNSNVLSYRRSMSVSTNPGSARLALLRRLTDAQVLKCAQYMHGPSVARQPGAASSQG